MLLQTVGADAGQVAVAVNVVEVVVETMFVEVWVIVLVEVELNVALRRCQQLDLCASGKDNLRHSRGWVRSLD